MPNVIMRVDISLHVCYVQKPVGCETSDRAVPEKMSLSSYVC